MVAMKWLTRDVFLIALSAFFADAGYQALIAGFPIFIVFYLKAPVYDYGLAMAIAFGIGSLFSYFGGVLGDRYGKRKIAILGNSLIPILSFSGMASGVAEAIGLFSAGWWARNFRSPARRGIMSGVSSRLDRGRAFGFLNALDVGGGVLAVAYLAVLLGYGISLRYIFLLTLIPIVASTLCLVALKYRDVHHSSAMKLRYRSTARRNRKTYFGVLAATMLYGLAFYSLGFPIITIAESSDAVAGIASYAVFLLVAAIMGYVIGRGSKNRLVKLALLGYFAAGIGSAVIGVSYAVGAGVFFMYVGVGVLGFAAGAIETLEPTIISLISKSRTIGRSMGSLGAARSLGIFMANAIMGIVYFVSPVYAYAYAGLLAISAAAIMLLASRGQKDI